MRKTIGSRRPGVLAGALALALSASLLTAGAATAEPGSTKVIKIATLAPEGSSWMREFHKWGKAVHKRTGVKVKFYAGSVAGDERDAVRKIRLGQLNGAAVTAIGLGLIAPEVRVLEVPFMVHNEDELHYVRGALDQELRQKFLDKGYVLLAWGDVGPVHLFSNIPVKSRADLAKLKMWAWTDDPVVRTLFQQVHLQGVPLGVPDVLSSLQTGLIDSCYGSPLSTLALQWFTKVKYVTSMVLSQAIGATVLSKAAWDGLTADQQAAVMDESKKLQDRLLKIVHDDNKAAMRKMVSLGMVEVPTPPDVEKEFQAQARIVARKLDGQLYTKEFRERVEKLLADYRAGKK